MMRSITLHLPELFDKSGIRPPICPLCNSIVFQRWGGGEKIVQDPVIHKIKVFRYRCCVCLHTFRYYPEGIDIAKQSLRIRKLTAFCIALGLSYRKVRDILTGLGVDIGVMTVWRAANEFVNSPKYHLIEARLLVKTYNEANIMTWKYQQPILVEADLGSIRRVPLGYIDAQDINEIYNQLTPLINQLGGSITIS